jgi:hypothetical protein
MKVVLEMELRGRCNSSFPMPIRPYYNALRGISSASCFIRPSSYFIYATEIYILFIKHIDSLQKQLLQHRTIIGPSFHLFPKSII